MGTAIRPRQQVDGPRMIIPFRQHGSVFDSPRVSSDETPPVQPRPANRLTLVDFYHERLMEYRRANLSPRTIDSDLDALNAWQDYTENIDLLSLKWTSKDQRIESLRKLRLQLQQFVQAQREKKTISGSSINTRLRHLRAMFKSAADPLDHGIIDHVPDLGRQFTGTKSAWQIKAPKLPPRETVTADEMVRLFHATEAADDPHLWKVLILLLWSYGARTEDTFFRLEWKLIKLQSMLMQFTANKTSKLQGVPLTPLIVRALKSLSTTDGPLFGKIPKGNWCKREGWKRGYYTTWSRDILPAGRFEVKKGPPEHKAASLNAEDVRANLMFNHFRKTMVTELNIYSGQAGNWVAAHYMSGVSEVSYDMPTERICTAVNAREADRLPDVWKQYFAEATPHEQPEQNQKQ